MTINEPAPSTARILVVDDEPRMLQSLGELLSLHGHQVHTASNGLEAASQLKRHEFDLLLLDLLMPGMNGLDVLSFIHENLLDPVVIVVSGESSLEVAVEALRRGAYDFIRKPYAAEELVRTIENAIRKRRLEEENRAMLARLQESEKLHRYMVNGSPDIVYMLDRDGRFTFLNDRIESLLGFRKGELVGMHYSALVYPEDLDRAHYAFTKTDDGGLPRCVEMRFKSRDNNFAARHFETSSIPVELGAADGNGRARFSTVYGVARDITDRKKAEEMIYFQAYYDLLTGLPNRTLFKDHLALAIAQAKRNGQPFAVMFLDLDRFKVVNDTLGHMAGDELLQAVGARLRDCLREGDTLARVGGDEFTILLPAIDSKEDASKIAGKILLALKRPFVLENQELFVSVSIGIAIYPQDGETLDALIKNADIAMYHMKGLGKDGYQLYSERMNALFCQHLSLENGMRKALETGQFAVFYQPQVDVRAGKIVGVEALIRWRHPVRGLVSPTEFIPLAEETGLIAPISEWMLRTACAEITRWHRAGLPPVRLAINFSALQVEQRDFVDMIAHMLDEAGFSGEHLEIELTESAIMKDMESVAHKLRTMNDLGIKIAVDDFGTGYSSLSYLHQLPIHTLKIDRSFIHGINGDTQEASIVNAIIAMANGLGLGIIAEGVETKTQLDYLRARGCAHMQGFLFSRPLPAEAAWGLLREERLKYPG